MKQRFDITGMSCSACSAAVERSVKKLKGINSCQVSLLTNSMSVDFDKNVTSESEIISAVTGAGYSAEISGSVKTEKKASTSNDGLKNMKTRLIVSFICLIPLMYIAMGHMITLPLPGFITGVQNGVSFAFIQFLLTLPVIYINRKYYINGFKALFNRAPNMDTLVATGSLAAILYGIYAIFAMSNAIGSGDTDTAMSYLHNLYFESGAMILTLITMGKYFEARSKQKTSDAIAKLTCLTPDTTIIEKDGIETEIPSDSIKPGDIVIVKNSTSIPVDGTVVYGSGTVDESAITGESIPVEKSTGDSVTGGTICKSGYFKFRAEKVGSETALAKILRLIEDAAASKAPIAKLADKVSGVFVPVVMAISVITFIVWLIIRNDFTLALDMAISVLIISCPCALGLATPTAIMVGTGKGASEGILVRSAESLETAHRINTVVLDKTGTVTKGTPEVTDIIPSQESDITELLTLAYSAEKMSEHPLSAAIVRMAVDKNITAYECTDFVNLQGKGICVKCNNSFLYGGNPSLMQQHNIDTSSLASEYNKLAQKGKTPLLFALGNRFLGIIAVADTIKETSRQAVSDLQSMGIDVIMLTGDNKKTASHIAQKAGITKVIADVLPDEKEAVIKNLQQENRIVAMVGDGINDAPALTRADVGIAIGAGTDVAIESADIVLMKSDLNDATGAIRLSKAVIKNIKQNLFWAFFYNILGIPLAAGILFIPLGIKLNPMIGAACMSMSSVCVVTNALRLRFLKIKKETPVTGEKERILNMKKTIYIDGMMCHHCTGRVDKVLNAVDGVEATVSLEDKCAYVTLSKDMDDSALKSIIENEGYTVIEIR